MKGRKFAGVLLLIGAVALVMIGAMYIMAIPKEKVAIDDSIMLKDGMYNAKNAGKRVTLILDYKSLEHALDEQLGLEFWATLVRRDVDRFERREGGGYQWKNVSINSVDPLRYKTLHGQTDGGDRVSLDPEFEKRITTKENLGVEDLTDWSLKDFKKGNTKRKVRAVVRDEVTYFTNAGDVAFVDLDKANGNKLSQAKLDSQVGKFRVRYTKMELHQKAVAVTGVQRGHLIKVDPKIGKPIVTTAKANKLFTKVDVMDRMTINHIIVFATAIVGAIILAFFGLGWTGVYVFGDRRKMEAAAAARRQREAEAEAEEKAWEQGGNVMRASKNKNEGGFVITGEVIDDSEAESESESKDNGGGDDNNGNKEQKNRDYIGEEKKRKKLEKKMKRKKGNKGNEEEKPKDDPRFSNKV